MKRKIKNYKFSDKKQSPEGIISTVIALVVIVLFIAGISISFENKGEGNIIVGILGFLAFIISLVGFFVGLHSFKKEDVFYHFSYIGLIANALLCLIMIVTILTGI